MKTHEFTLVLDREPDEAEADRFYSLVNDATLITLSGVATAEFHRDAESLESAIRSAIADVVSAGFVVKRVELAPEAVALVR
jgi:hypothetical protein